VLELNPTEPPTGLGVTHRSSRLLAGRLAAEGQRISHVTIARIWHRFGVQPWRAQTIKFSTDPHLEGKIRGVVGLYLHSPAKAVVLCIDEKPQVHALQRTAPGQASPHLSSKRPNWPHRRCTDPVLTALLAPTRTGRNHRSGFRHIGNSDHGPGVAVPRCPNSTSGSSSSRPESLRDGLRPAWTTPQPSVFGS
jgi:hypothetical protein